MTMYPNDEYSPIIIQDLNDIFTILKNTGKVVNAIKESKDDQYWIGTSTSGLYSYNIKTRQTTSYQRSDNPNSITKNVITTLVIDNRKRLWVGTYGQGLCRYIEDSEFSVSTLAQELGMSRTSVFTKIKGIIGMTPNDFIKITRLKKTCRMMIEGEYRVTEIGFLVGFSSSSYFAKCFQKQFGMLPTEFLKKAKENPSSIME